MKNIHQILNLLLAITLVVMAIKITMQNTDDSNKISSKMDNENNTALQTIFDRTSVRSYTSKKVEPEKVELLLRAAMAAPTAGNKQPWSFVVVDDRALLDTLAANMPYAKMASKANVAIIVCGDSRKMYEGKESEYWIQDCSAATENLLLAAQSLGLGAVWTGVYPMADRVEKLKSLLNMPDHLIPLNVIPVGYPAAENKPKDKWDPSKVHTNTFAD